MTTRQIILLTTASAILSAALTVWLLNSFVPQRQVIIHEQAEARHVSQNDWLSEVRPRTFLSSTPTDFTRAADAVTPAVVFIRAYYSNTKSRFRRRATTETSTGSGVIIAEDGLIITNHHVIEGSERIEVTLSDKREFTAEIVGKDPSTDLALLRIEATTPAIELGNSDSLRIGEWVLAVGNPFNLESTVTAGIVSAKGRNIDILEGQDRIESFIQTDAVVNPGNSGGALVNTNGELIGVNTAIITRSGGYEGYSFAVPANLVRKVVRDLRDYGMVQRALLGTFINEVTPDLAAENDLAEIAGVVVTRIEEGSGAEAAELQRGDIILSIDNTPTKTVPQLQEILAQKSPGDRVQVQLVRNGQTRTVWVELRNKRNSTSPLAAADELLLRRLGFELRTLGRDERTNLGQTGVKVISILRGSTIEETNMEPGFIITKMNNRRVRTPEDVLQILQKTEEEVFLEGVYEDYEGAYFYSFRL
ncbi:MAG: trypsin-like peptidase domain-containing protein [Bacteroidota bacterium]